MLTSKFILALSLAVAVSGAFAEANDQSLFGWAETRSTLTREQVRQEMRDAIARGDRFDGERGYVPAPTPSKPRSRAEVLAELREAMRLGLLAVGDGDIPVATAAQERLIAKAGRDAAERVATAAVDSKD
jgi:hypothetical protein